MNSSLGIHSNFDIKSKGLDILALLLCFTIFSKELFTVVVASFSLDFYGYSFFTLYFFLFIASLRFNLKFLAFMFCVTAISVVMNIRLGLQISPFLKQIIPLYLILFSTYDILTKRRFQLKRIFELYVKISFYTAIFGIFQMVVYYGTGIKLIMNNVGKLDSISYEPSHYAAVIMPAAIYSFFNYKSFKKETITLFIALALTLTMTSYVVLLGVLMLTYLNFYNFLIVLLIGYLTYTFLPLVHEDFALRITNFEALLKGNIDKTASDYGDAGTIVSMASNFDVARQTLEKSPAFGSGIGGHESMYTRIFKGSPFEKTWFYGLNQRSAHSLSIRILSEMGYIGFLSFIFFLWRTSFLKIRKGFSSSHFYRITSIACLSHFFCKTLKLGGYIDYGTPFFFIFLIVNLICYKQNIEQL